MRHTFFYEKRNWATESRDFQPKKSYAFSFFHSKNQIVREAKAHKRDSIILYVPFSESILYEKYFQTKKNFREIDLLFDFMIFFA